MCYPHVETQFSEMCFYCATFSKNSGLKNLITEYRQEEFCVKLVTLSVNPKTDYRCFLVYS